MQHLLRIGIGPGCPYGLKPERVVPNFFMNLKFD